MEPKINNFASDFSDLFLGTRKSFFKKYTINEQERFFMILWQEDGKYGLYQSDKEPNSEFEDELENNKDKKKIIMKYAKNVIWFINFNHLRDWLNTIYPNFPIALDLIYYILDRFIEKGVVDGKIIRAINLEKMCEIYSGISESRETIINHIKKYIDCSKKMKLLGEDREVPFVPLECFDILRYLFTENIIAPEKYILNAITPEGESSECLDVFAIYKEIFDENPNFDIISARLIGIPSRKMFIIKNGKSFLINGYSPYIYHQIRMKLI
jgi:hypothetical protein